MNHSSNFIYNSFLTSILCAFVTCLCFGQISKKTFQTVITDNAETVRLDIKDAKVELKETKGSRLLIETSIRLSVPNEALLSFVIANGRYKLTQTLDPSNRVLTLASKKDKNVILVKGEICDEAVTYVIYVPKNIRAIKD